MIWQKIKSIFSNKNRGQKLFETGEKYGLYDIIMGIVRDGDCIGIDNIIICVQVYYPQFSKETIINTVNMFLENGILISDKCGSIIDPKDRPNYAKRIADGKCCWHEGKCW